MSEIERSTGQVISVALVDDQEMVLAGFAALCVNCPDLAVIGSATTGRRGLEMIRRLVPAVALIDVSLTDLDGVTIALGLRDENCPTRIILTAEKPDLRWFQAALDIPVAGFLVKNSTAEELLLAIRAVAGGALHYASKMQKYLLPGALDAAGISAKPLLNGEQRCILQLLAIGLSSKEIAEEMGMDDARQVERLRLKMMKKFRVHNASQLVVYAIAHGLIRLPDGNDRPPASTNGSLDGAPARNRSPREAKEKARGKAIGQSG
jgi:DNA-binding NarL/FixJ family response regulator